MAARELAEMGYTNVIDYAGGKQEWVDAGYPTETDHDHSRAPGGSGQNLRA